MPEPVRVALVGADLIVANVVLAPAGWRAPIGQTAIASAVAAPGDLYDPVQGSFGPPPGALDAARQAAREAVQRRRDAILAAGAPYRGARIEVDDASRANVSGVATAALLAQANGLEWPEAVQTFIAADNSLLPIPAPADAVALGLAVLAWYAGLMQFARRLKTAVLAAEDPWSVATAADWSPWEG